LIQTASEWKTLNGVDGWIFGIDDNTIFLPAAGGREDENGFLLNHALWTLHSVFGIYWSNSSNWEMSWGVMEITFKMINKILSSFQ